MSVRSDQQDDQFGILANSRISALLARCVAAGAIDHEHVAGVVDDVLGIHRVPDTGHGILLERPDLQVNREGVAADTHHVRDAGEEQVRLLGVGRDGVGDLAVLVGSPFTCCHRRFGRSVERRASATRAKSSNEPSPPVDGGRHESPSVELKAGVFENGSTGAFDPRLIEPNAGSASRVGVAGRGLERERERGPRLLARGGDSVAVQEQELPDADDAGRASHAGEETGKAADPGIGIRDVLRDPGREVRADRVVVGASIIVEGLQGVPA